MNSGLKSKIQDWWDELEYEVQFELMEYIIPDYIQLVDADDMWNRLDWEVKYQIYCQDDNKIEFTDEEKAEIVGDREAHRRMVEE